MLEAAEVWTETDGRLALRQGAHGEHESLRHLRELTHFFPGVGVVGRAWQASGPVVLDPRGGARELDGALSRAGVAAVVGIPVRDARQTRAVLALHLRASGGGVAEVWEPRDADATLGLCSGHYGAHDDFRRLSALMRFPSGVGLPGVTHARQEPVVMEDLDVNEEFMRAVAARSLGLQMGIGVPFFAEGRVASVLVLITGKLSPLMRGFQVWRPSTPGRHLELSARASAGVNELTTDDQVGMDLANDVWASGLPALRSAPPRGSGVPAAPVTAAAIPVFRADTVVSVVVLFF